MSHTYLIDLYDLIDQRLEEISEETHGDDSGGVGSKFQQGRVEILMECKEFLAEHYNSKLPRRLRQRYPA